MNELMRKLETISEKCIDDKKKKEKQEEEKNLDEFTRLKKKISKDIKSVREHINERNELLGKSENNTSTVKMSAEIRGQLKTILKEIDQLKTMVDHDNEKIEKKKAKGKTVSESEEKQFQLRQEIVDLCYKHMEECKRLERTGFQSPQSAMISDEKNDATVTALPDIDAEEFQILRKNDALIDTKLKLVSEGVTVLREMALEMGKEVELQEVMITELDKKVDDVQKNLNQINVRMKKALQNVRRGDRFIIDFILVCVILGIIYYIYTLSKNG